MSLSSQFERKISALVNAEKNGKIKNLKCYSELGYPVVSFEKSKLRESIKFKLSQKGDVFERQVSSKYFDKLSKSKTVGNDISIETNIYDNKHFRASENNIKIHKNSDGSVEYFKSFPLGLHSLDPSDRKLVYKHGIIYEYKQEFYSDVIKCTKKIGNKEKHKNISVNKIDNVDYFWNSNEVIWSKFKLLVNSAKRKLVNIKRTIHL